MRVTIQIAPAAPAINSTSGNMLINPGRPKIMPQLRATSPAPMRGQLYSISGFRMLSGA